MQELDELDFTLGKEHDFAISKNEVLEPKDLVIAHDYNAKDMLNVMMYFGKAKLRALYKHKILESSGKIDYLVFFNGKDYVFKRTAEKDDLKKDLLKLKSASCISHAASLLNEEAEENLSKKFKEFIKNINKPRLHAMMRKLEDGLKFEVKISTSVEKGWTELPLTKSVDLNGTTFVSIPVFLKSNMFLNYYGQIDHKDMNSSVFNLLDEEGSKCSCIFSGKSLKNILKYRKKVFDGLLDGNIKMLSTLKVLMYLWEMMDSHKFTRTSMYNDAHAMLDESLDFLVNIYCSL